MKIILTFRMKNTSTQTVVFKQTMDELNEINNFNLNEQLSCFHIIAFDISSAIFHIQFLFQL